VTKPVLHASGLRKEFGDFTAVDGIDFEVAPGESFGFLGPNGAGKTSTMRMIGCVSPATAGTLRVFGLDPQHDGPAIRARLGVVPQADQLDEELTVAENIQIYGRYFDISRAECKRRTAELLEFVQLSERANDLVDPLSGGMKRRLTIARSLINEPEMLLLDEPTTGLDPQARHVLWDRLYRLKQRGVTLVLTTHYMDEAEQLCDRLVVMDVGKIVAVGAPRELIQQHCTREVLELRFAPTDLAAGDNQGDAGVDDAERNKQRDALVADIGERVESLPDRVLIYVHDGDAALNEIHRRGIEPAGALVRRSSLEDVFLRLTGRTLVD
jgi:lipooligosaccharide transport system ATP-binding protein